MRIDVITLFPAMIEAVARETILGRAQKGGRTEIVAHQLRDYATDKHRTVDDRPYGGGPGMVLRCDVMASALQDVQGKAPAPGRVILLSPGGRTLTQEVARELSAHPRLVFLSGHYEGVDQRVADHLVDEELSIGDYVLTNGTLAALVVIDAVVRLLPGVLGNEASAGSDSFSEGLLEGPQYTRPPEFNGWKVPEILLSGHHGQIEAWRKGLAEEKTALRRKKSE
ncbi:MAG: tRNA (guanosine(37)-N1)-methyltransferase TrmD [Verrucomicrobium sp.]|nr:tRNA (guanosine(37)-N1)-methyltransferase TrmD [Verrucomicrobium sp.]